MESACDDREFILTTLRELNLVETQLAVHASFNKVLSQVSESPDAKVGDECWDAREKLKQELALAWNRPSTATRIDAAKLREDPGSLLSPGVFARLPRMAQL